MRTVRTQDAVGMILCQDVTKITKDFKGAAFRKGHIVREEDVEELLNIGKYHLYVWDDYPGLVHEDDAALRLADILDGGADNGISRGELKEGKINFYAAFDGLLKVDAEELFKLNMIDEIMAATLHTDTPVKKSELLGGTRVIPLAIADDVLKKAEADVKKGVMRVLPFKPAKIGVVIIGTEVCEGRIKDAFGPVLLEKAAEYGCAAAGTETVPDDADKIAAAVGRYIDDGCGIVFCAGGMSVDADDLTPAAIKQVCGELVTYGSPILPGAMFLLAYKGGAAVMGLPGCVMHSKRTALDLVLPRVLAGERLTKSDIARYGHGGQCRGCGVCVFPACGFGKA